MRINQAVKLVGNYNTLDAIKTEAGIHTTCGLFNDFVFKDTNITPEEMQVLIKYSEPLKTRSVPKKVLKSVLKVVREFKVQESESS